MKQLLMIVSALLFFVAADISAQETQHHTNHSAMVTETAVADSVKPAEVKTAFNTVCPVMGNKVKSSAPLVEYNGKVYGFCCPGCDAKFAKEPEKYSKNLNEEGTRFIGKK